MEKLNLVKDRKFGENISMAFDFIKDNFAKTKTLIIYLIIIAGIGGVLAGIPVAGSFLSPLVSIFAGILIISYTVSYMKLYVDSADGNINEEELKEKTKKYLVKLLLAGIVYGLAVFVGMILLVIPGIYIAIAFLFYAFCIINDDLGIVDGLKRSNILVKNNWFVTLGYSIVIGLILGILSSVFSLVGTALTFLGVIGTIIGTFITLAVSFIVSVISYFALGVHYYNLVDKSEGVFSASQIDSIGQNE